jgi:hypothetical protein
VAAYLAAVRAALADLGADERDDLLVEVESSLIEAADEDGGPIAARLGPPEEFAAELRASAGLEPAAGTTAPTEPGLWAVVRAAVVAGRTDRRVQAVERAARDLAPIWWLLRAYAGFVLVAKLLGADWSFGHPAIPRVGSGRLSVVVLLAAVAASVTLGLRERRRGRPISRTALAVNLILAVAALPASVHLLQVASSPAPRDAIFSVPTADPGLTHDGAPVLNIYPYTRDGRLLHDILLYDDAGRPLDIKPGDVDPARRVLTAPDGQRIFDSFPIRYFDPGTTRVARPNAAPPLQPPSLFVPPAVGKAPAAPAVPKAPAVLAAPKARAAPAAPKASAVAPRPRRR